MCKKVGRQLQRKQKLQKKKVLVAIKDGKAHVFASLHSFALLPLSRPYEELIGDNTDKSFSKLLVLQC